MATLAAPFDVPQKDGNEFRIACAAVLNYRGGAAAVLFGTGYATPLVVATAKMAFIGVYLEGIDNSAGAAGDKYVRIARSGIFAFNQTGLVQADVGKIAYFSDDNTITLTPGAVKAGTIVTIDQANSKAWVSIGSAIRSPERESVQAITANGAVAPNSNGTYAITKAGVAALTLAAPTADVDDGVIIRITSATANAHTLTATGLLYTGAAAVDVATFANQKGAGLALMAYQGKWHVLYQIGITFS